MNKLMAKMKSDRAAANTVEIIIIIALAVFAALALFTYILTPTQDSADKLGKGIDGGIDSILKSKGDTTGIDFSGSGK